MLCRSTMHSGIHVIIDLRCTVAYMLCRSTMHSGIHVIIDLRCTVAYMLCISTMYSGIHILCIHDTRRTHAFVSFTCNERFSSGAAKNSTVTCWAGKGVGDFIQTCHEQELLVLFSLLGRLVPLSKS